MSAEPAGLEALLRPLPQRATPLAQGPQLEPFVARSLETGSLLVVAGARLATKQPAAQEAPMTSPEREVVQQVLLVLGLSKRQLPQPPPS